MNIKQINNTNYFYNFDTKELLNKNFKIVKRKSKHKGWEITNNTGYPVLLTDEATYLEGFSEENGNSGLAYESNIVRWTRETDLDVDQEIDSLRDLPMAVAFKEMHNATSIGELTMKYHKCKTAVYEKQLEIRQRDLVLQRRRMANPHDLMDQYGISQASRKAWLDRNEKHLNFLEKEVTKLIDSIDTIIQNSYCEELLKLEK